jgi:uncharacterized protein YqhQ
MVNEERLHYMIKMAEFDTNDRKASRPMMQYARRDYVSLQLLKSFIVGTIAFGVLFALWALYSMDSLLGRMNNMDFMDILLVVGILYGVFIVIYLLATYLVYNLKYTEGRRKVKKYYNGLKKVNAMYEREERLKINNNKDWEA